MLQQEQPDDFVIATGVQYSVRQFVEAAAAELGIHPILMPSQDILLSDIAPEMRASIERELRDNGITLASLYGDGPWPVRRCRHAAWR
jgi:hypothetical protein